MMSKASRTMRQELWTCYMGPRLPTSKHTVVWNKINSLTIDVMVLGFSVTVKEVITDIFNK